jgi:hypothetical protein
MIELWSINRWLRWTGFVLIVATDDRAWDDPERVGTKIGIVWVGLPPERAWDRHCARTRGELL